jgi:hypothetical protein
MTEPRPRNYTTAVSARTSIGECADMLIDAGAAAVTITAAGGERNGISFELDTPAGHARFHVAVNIDGMAALLTKLDAAGKLPGPGGGKGRVRALYQTRDHAAAVAWRVTRDWLDAQLARIAADQSTLAQAMLGHLVTGPGQTLYDQYEARAIEPAGSR